MRSLAAEFPNDNPELHAGACWVCLDVIGAPAAIAPPVIEEAVSSRSVAEILTEAIPEARISGIVGLGETSRADLDLDLDLDEEEEEEPIVVEELPPLEESAMLEGVAPPASIASAPTTTIAPPPPDDPWVVFVATLADVAIGAGSPHVASVLHGLLVEGLLPTLPVDVMKALSEANVVRGEEVDPAFVARTRAWIGILRGTSDDFEACGNSMLDEWGADLVARLLGSPSRAEGLKRDLRARGIAAFGLAA